jgi:hypothetical protein
MKVFTVVTVLSLPLASWASSQLQRGQANFTVGKIVETSSGPVAGHAAPTAPEVSEYLGIPYAQAPVGDLRFAAPVKFAGSPLINGSYVVGHLIIQTDSSSLTILPLTYVVLGFHMP